MGIRAMTHPFPGRVRGLARVLVAIWCFILTATCLAQWPQWRGPTRDGHVQAAPRQANWPERLSLVWERDVGGGYSGPVGDEEYLYVHSRQGSREAVTCLRLANGDVVWTESYDAPFRQDPSGTAHGQGPYSTPALAGGRLFTFGVRGILIAWDAATGRRLWTKDSAWEFEHPFPAFGEASSPLVWGDLCFVHLGGHNRDRYDESRHGAMVALNVADGRERWRWTREAAPIGASPVICEFDGEPHLVFKGKRGIFGLNPRNGWQLWEIPYEVSQDNTIVTPVCAGGLLVTSDYDWGMAAWRIRSVDGRGAAQPVWKHRTASIFTNTPVVVNGVLVGFSHFRRGQLFGLEPATGRVLWVGDPRSGEHASLIAWGEDVLYFREDGSLVVGPVDRGAFRPRRTYDVGGGVAWTHPAVIGERIIVREGQRVKVYQLAGT